MSIPHYNLMFSEIPTGIIADMPSRLHVYPVWIAKAEISLTTKRHLLVNVPETAYYVLRGARTGPVVLVTAGVHGTEIAGVFAAEELRNVRVQRGTLIVVPRVNVRALRQRKRGTPDLNRSFPRHASDTARHDISQKLLSLVNRYRPVWCIDLHEANGFYRRNRKALGQTIIVYPNQQSAQTVNRVIETINRTIRHDHRKFSMKQGKLRGSLRTAFGEIFGCHAITVETSMQQPLQTRVRDQLTILRTLCRDIGITWAAKDGRTS